MTAFQKTFPANPQPFLGEMDAAGSRKRCSKCGQLRPLSHFRLFSGYDRRRDVTRTARRAECHGCELAADRRRRRPVMGLWP